MITIRSRNYTLTELFDYKILQSIRVFVQFYVYPFEG